MSPTPPTPTSKPNQALLAGCDRLESILRTRLERIREAIAEHA